MLKIHYAVSNVTHQDAYITMSISILRVIIYGNEEIKRLQQLISEKVGYNVEIAFSCFYNHYSYRNYPSFLSVNTSKNTYFYGQVPHLDLSKISIKIIPDWDSSNAKQELTA